MKIRVNQFYDNVDCPREFVCAHCGTRVYVTDIKDSTGEKNQNKMLLIKKEAEKKQ